MSDEPKLVPLNEEIKIQLNSFMGVLGTVLVKELDDIEKDMENLANVLKHHRSVEPATKPKPSSTDSTD
jgi:hypothetical protein